jgi:hypothetical protein
VTSLRRLLVGATVITLGTLIAFAPHWWPRHPVPPSPLIGVWRTDPTDTAALARFGDTTVDFQKNGTLVYTIHKGSEDQVMLYTYREVAPGVIETDEPSHPGRERARYQISPSGYRMTLQLGQETAEYIREE